MRIKDVCFVNCDFALFISIYFIIVIVNMIRDNQIYMISLDCTIFPGRGEALATSLPIAPPPLSSQCFCISLRLPPQKGQYLYTRVRHNSRTQMVTTCGGTTKRTSFAFPSLPVFDAGMSLKISNNVLDLYSCNCYSVNNMEAIRTGWIT